MDRLEIARERFRSDSFATGALGAVIEAVDENGAICSVELGKRHLNGAGFVMGGAIFTLADFTFAVAANTMEDVTVTQTSQITYLETPKGKKLIADAKLVKSGRKTCFYVVEIKDELDTDVAYATITGFRKSKKREQK